MLLGLSLFYVGAVLILNGLWLLGHIEDREIGVINLFTGTITFLVSLYMAFGAGADATSINGAAMSLLFSFTYFWVALNRVNGSDGRGLGWFSLFVAITAVLVAVGTLSHAASGWDIWSGLSWASWSVLWALYFVLLVLKRNITRFTGWVAITIGITTGWLPGYLLLNGLIG